VILALSGAVAWLLLDRQRTQERAAAASPAPASSTPPTREAEAPSAPRAATPTPRAAGDSPPALEDLLGSVLPAVVGLQSAAGFGSGFFVGPGLVVTNRHVVAGVDEVSVKTSDAKELPAKVYVRARDFDLALVQLYGTPAQHAVLPLARLEDVRVGQDVIAVGSPLGLQNTVTRGIVSAVRTEDGVSLIQSDAAINPGNSGGPLVDRRGRVIGVTTHYRGLQGSRGQVLAGEALGFSIAADHVRSLVDGKLASVPFVPASERDPLALWRSSVPEAEPAADASSAEALRSRGDDVLQARLLQLAEFAAGIDRLWREIQQLCGDGRPPDARAPRPWLRALPASPGFLACGSSVAEVERRARQLKAGMERTEEDARRAGVLPGRVRELRARHDLEW
jgi:putative serine protease PepD